MMASGFGDGQTCCESPPVLSLPPALVLMNPSSFQPLQGKFTLNDHSHLILKTSDFPAFGVTKGSDGDVDLPIKLDELSVRLPMCLKETFLIDDSRKHSRTRDRG